MDREAVVGNVTTLAMNAIQAGEQGTGDDPGRLQFEIDRTQKKKEAVLDSYFSQEITKEDMISMKDKYDEQIRRLQERQRQANLRNQEKKDMQAMKAAIESEVKSILNGETESEVFSKILLDRLTVFKDRHMELTLNGLPQVFQFVG